MPELAPVISDNDADKVTVRLGSRTPREQTTCHVVLECDRELRELALIGGVSDRIRTLCCKHDGIRSLKEVAAQLENVHKNAEPAARRRARAFLCATGERAATTCPAGNSPEGR